MGALGRVYRLAASRFGLLHETACEPGKYLFVSGQAGLREIIIDEHLIFAGAQAVHMVRPTSPIRAVCRVESCIDACQWTDINILAG